MNKEVRLPRHVSSVRLTITSGIIEDPVFYIGHSICTYTIRSCRITYSKSLSGFSMQQPYFSYSARDPMKYFSLSTKEAGDWGDTSPPLHIPQSGTVQWVTAACAVSRPQLLDILNSSVGAEQLIYLYAKACVYTYITCALEELSV